MGTWSWSWAWSGPWLATLNPCSLYPGNTDIQNGNVKLILGLTWSLIGNSKPCPLYPGNTDIQNGNVKLILGLIWSLIAHYQLGASNFPPKKLMLAWLKVSNRNCEGHATKIRDHTFFCCLWNSTPPPQASTTITVTALPSILVFPTVFFFSGFPDNSKK